ncbi:hypothetical protein [Klebsiella pneumoniae]
MTRNPGDESVEVLHKRAVARFNSLTYAISSMLSKAKLLPIPELQLNNPTFEEVVSQLRLYRALSEKVAELLKIDRKDELAELDAYIELADDLAQAIVADNPEGLCAAIAALDEKPYV